MGPIVEDAGYVAGRLAVEEYMSGSEADKTRFAGTALGCDIGPAVVAE
jgi:hypothetical protein